jgi:hypothetical protein
MLFDAQQNEMSKIVVLRIVPQASWTRMRAADNLLDEFRESTAMQFGVNCNAIKSAIALRGEALVEKICTEPMLFYGMLAVCESADEANQYEKRWFDLLASMPLLVRADLADKKGMLLRLAEGAERVVDAVAACERERGVVFADAFETVSVIAGDTGGEEGHCCTLLPSTKKRRYKEI